jgi:hypothetical protein
MVEQRERMPDLVVNRCPVNCFDCKTEYFNREILHRIICKCPCHFLTEYRGKQKDNLQSASMVASPKRIAVVTSTTNIEDNTIER